MTSIGVQKYYECKVCLKSMAGIIPAQAHLQGSHHMKALRNYTCQSSISACMDRFTLDDADGTPFQAPTPDIQPFPSSPRSQSPSPLPLKSSGSFDIDTARNLGIVTEEMVLNQKVFTCTLCSITCSGDIPMKQHLIGEPHLKKERRLNTSDRTTPVARPENNSYACDSNLSSTTRMNSLSDRATDRAKPLESDSYCSSSNSSFTVLPAPPTNSDDLLQSAIDSDIVSHPLGVDQSHLLCNICQLTCTGETPMKQHLRGASHQKKMKILNTSDRGSPMARPEINSYACDLSSTTRMNSLSDRATERAKPLESDSYHSSSNSSFAVLPAPPTNSDDLLQSAINSGIVIHPLGADQSHLLCNICQLTCTGETPMKQHLRGTSHQKKMKAKSLFVGPQQRNIVTSNPENVCKSFTSPSQVQSSCDSSKDILESAKDEGIIIETDDALECVICSVTCTGGAPMTDHLNGEAHSKKRRDQIHYQQFMLQTLSKEDSTSPPPTSPARDTETDTTSLSPVLRSSSPNAMASSCQYEGHDHDDPDSVSQTVSSTKEDDGCSSIPLHNVPVTGKEVKIYTSSHPLDDLFD
ncbi:zinc finger protein 385B-like isoform X2 [Panulirus ornatus]